PACPLGRASLLGCDAERDAAASAVRRSSIASSTPRSSATSTQSLLARGHACRPRRPHGRYAAAHAQRLTPFGWLVTPYPPAGESQELWTYGRFSRASASR